MPAATPARTGFAESVRTRRRSLISLTPLIDVVFILLVFFMLASSFADWRAIDLTQPESTGGGEPMTGAILIDVREGSIRMSGLPVSIAAMQAQAETHVRRAPERLFIVRPADGVSLQQAIIVMDGLSAAGVTRLSLTAGGGR